jgi:hypothetical protein
MSLEQKKNITSVAIGIFVRASKNGCDGSARSGGAGSQTDNYLHYFNNLITYCCLGELLPAG